MLLIGVDGISFLLGIDGKEKNVFDFFLIIYYLLFSPLFSYFCFLKIAFKQIFSKHIFILKKKIIKTSF